MAVKGKGKEIAGKTPASSSSSAAAKRKKTVSRSTSKKRRPGVLQFFDDVALDDDYDSEQDDDEDNDDDEGLDLDNEDLDIRFSNLPKADAKGVKGGGRSNHLPFYLKEEDLSGDELEELIKDRYGQGVEYAVYGDDPKECDANVSEDHSSRDPIIWRVKCMVGREQQLAFCFMQKYIDLQEIGAKLEIISAFSLDHVKGYVYIEAYKESDVLEACKGFCNIYFSRIARVPSNELPQLLCVRNKPCAVSNGTWVRMKNGKYKGDLGQVVAVDEVRKRATIKMVPRIDLQAISKKFGGGISLRQAAVPAPRLISSLELEHFRPHIETKRDRETGEVFEVLDGLMLKDGYLHKKVSITSLVYWGVQPSKDELLKFTDMNRDEDNDVSWLSSIYDGNKKTKQSQATDSKGSVMEKDRFDLHDLVFFGKKAFGVVISIGKDNIQILKGDAEGQEVVAVKTSEIRNSCADKMFTASDRHMKTIFINDMVKILEGPLEGRQGLVRHMYKGSLFIYDETQPENSGFFCAKSNLCQNIKQHKDFSSKNSVNNPSTSFAQSPIISFEQEQEGSKYRRSETNQTFSVGQTLRIRKGPLKGYLCRVVGVYRSDITVKLDSLGKVITVGEQFLSIPNIRRDDTTSLPSDIFGSQPTGGFSDEATEKPTGLNSWDSGRDSWQPFSTSGLLLATNNDQKQGEEQVIDPWGSKVPARENPEQGADPWGSKLESVAEEDPEKGADPWGSKLEPVAKDQDQAADPWGSKLAPPADQEQAADPWGSKVALTSGSKVALTSRDKEQGSDPWGSDWAKASITSGPQNSSRNMEAKADSEKDADVWSKSSVKSTTETDGWAKGKHISGDAGQCGEGKNKDSDVWNKPSAGGLDKVKLPIVEAGEGWGSKSLTNQNQSETSGIVLGRWDGKQANLHCDTSKNTGGSNVWDKAADNNGGKGDGWEQSNNWTQPDVGAIDKAVAWDIKGKGVARTEDGAWGKATEPQRKDDNGSKQWGNSFDGSNQRTTGSIASSDKVDAWDIKGKGVARTGDGAWGKATEPQGKDDIGSKQWGNSFDGSNQRTTGNITSSDNVDAWDIKGKGVARTEDSTWGKATESQGKQTAGWDAGSISLTEPVEQHGGQMSSWDKVKVPSDNKCGWGTGDWSKSSTQSHTDEWNKSKSFGGDQVSTWSKADNVAAGKNDQYSWDKPRDSEAGRGGFDRGRGRGRGRGRSTWDNGNGDQERQWNKPMDDDGGKGSGWGRRQDGGNAAGDSRDQENSWSRQNDFDGGRGSSWRRGRGRNQYGGRGSGDGDNQDRPSDSGGGWGSGRGRGRGRYGSGGTASDNFDDTRSPGRGGRGRGRGRFQSDWKNNQENFADGNQSSAWKKDEGSNWNKPKFSGGHQSSSWGDRSSGSQEEWGGGQSEGWNRGGDFGRDQSFGGRGDSFSNRGRGRGSNSGGRGSNSGGGRSFGWNKCADTNNEGKGSWGQSENSSRHESFGKEQPSSWSQNSWSKGNESCGDQPGWNAGGNADKGSWENQQSSAGKQPSSWTKQDSSWNKDCSAGTERGKNGGGSWDQPKGFGSSGESWNQKVSDAVPAAGGSRVWASNQVPAKEAGWASGKQENAWGGGSSHKEEQSDFNRKGSGAAGAGSSGWNCGGGSVRKDDGWGGGAAEVAESASIWNSNRGAATKEEDAGGDRGSSWTKSATTSWGGSKDGNGGGGGW